jgi:hypothetical protein
VISCLNICKRKKRKQKENKAVRHVICFMFLQLITGNIKAKAWSFDMPSVNNWYLFSNGSSCLVISGLSNAMNLDQFQCGVSECVIPRLKDFLPNLHDQKTGGNEIEEMVGTKLIP